MFDGYYRAHTLGADALDQKHCMIIAVLLTPYMMGMEIMMNGGLELYMSSLPEFGDTARRQGQNGAEGRIVVWFGDNVMGAIAVQDIQVDGNLLQTAVGNRNVERRRGNMSATILSNAERSRSPPSNQVPLEAMLDGHRQRLCVRR